MSVGDMKQRIRERAYELWEREGRPHGRHLDHWVQAEGEARLGKIGGFEGFAAERPSEAMQPSGGVERGLGGAPASDHASAVRGGAEPLTGGQPARASEPGQSLAEKPSSSRRKPGERQDEPAPKRGGRRKQ